MIVVAVGLLLLAHTIVVDAEGAEDGDFEWDFEISNNNLGRLSNACSKFCHAGVSGLDLWLSFSSARLATDNQVSQCSSCKL